MTNAAVNKDKIDAMVSSAFNLADSIKACFQTNEGSIVTQSFLGTVVNVGNGGTFVSYGGKYIGYGMTPNIRNAVVECNTMGKVYIYDGTFEGRCGANIFNIVKYNNNNQKITQFVEDANGNVSEKTTYMKTDETNGAEILSMVNKTDANGNVVYDASGNAVKVPVNTSNIRVRGGTFRCYYEGVMVGLNEDTKEGANDHNSDQMTVFPGSCGGVNLGVESYNEDLIRDGRIQIVDSYGDGALVLMDDHKEAGDKSIFHYRLFCTDEELRNNRYLVVYPNEPDSNSTYSFSLQTRYGGQDASNYEDVSQFWSSEEENDRGVFSSDEKFFTYPINDKDLSEKYYVIPYLTNTDVYGENLDTSEVWFYNTPTDTRGRKIESFTYAVTSAYGTVNNDGYIYQGYCQQKNYSDSEWKKIEKQFVSNQATYKEFSENYRNNVKWITYKVYRVDPLTRENITTVFGVDQPVVEVCYGAASDTALKCRLPLNKLGIDYQAGEMYRVVMSVDEYLSYDGAGKKLDKASCESSIVFMCYDTNEYKVVNKEKVEDYTPVQWVSEPKSGSVAAVQIVNGQAGKVDYQHRKIFDVYYQWYEVNPDGEDILIAGTDNIYTKKLDDYTADLAGLKKHNFRQMLPGTDDYTYVNTVNPSDPKASAYGENGLPADTADWTVEMLHAYIESNTPNATLAKNAAYDPTPQNNKAMATGIDRCYIPESLEGKTIYCKVTAVNSYWMRNFDHVQVFYSHKITVPIETKPLEVSMNVTYNGDYLTKDNQAAMTLSEIKGLDPDEKVTKVEFMASRGGSRVVTFDNLSVVNAASVKSVTYPKDFFAGGGKVTSLGANENIQLKAKIYTNKDRAAMTDVTLVDYEVPAENLDFDYHGYYFYEGMYHHINNQFVDEVSINVSPRNASIGYDMFEGGSFTSSDPEVASFDSVGKLIPGTKEGRTTITLTTPKGETKTLVYANPIQKVEITGIDAPVVGENFDLTGDVPEDAGYTVKEVYWTEGKHGDRLPSDAVAEMYHSYTAHVVVQENSGQEFNTDEFDRGTNGVEEHWVQVPYTMTVNLDDETTDTLFGTLEGSEDNVWKADRQNTVEATYNFSAYAEGVSSVIDTVAINFPTDIQEGDDIQAWKDQVEILTGADEVVSVNPRIDFYGQADNVLKPLGYESQKFGLFMKGVQRGFTAEIKIPSNLELTFADTLTVTVNGDDTFTCEINKTDKNAYISLYDVFDITGDAAIEPAPVVNIANAYMAVGETLNVEELISTDANVKVALREYSYWNDYYTAYPETNNIYAKQVYSGASGNMIIDVFCDANNDGVYESNVGGYTGVRIYDTPDNIPDLDTMIVTVTEMNPEGEVVYTGKRYFDQDSDDKFSIPEIEDAFITDIEASEGNYYLTDGCDRISQSEVTSNRSITVHSVAAEELKVAPGTDEVYAYFTNMDITALFISVDGIHYHGGGYLDGLTPDTEYQLYYKQGVNGTVYNKSFKTANQFYGVYVGQVPVTDKNTGNLEKDGWQYEPENQKLTLKNLTLKSVGAVAETEDYLGVAVPVYTGVIASDSNLTVELIGDNALTKFKDSSMYQGIIYAAGDLTLSGSGNLEVTSVKGISGRGLYSKGNVVLDSTGSVIFNTCLTGVDISDYTNDSVTYKNGEYIFRPDFYYNSYYIGSLIDSRINVVLNSTHTLSAAMGYSLENIDTQTVAVEDIVSAMKGQIQENGSSCFLHVKPVHSCTKKVQSAEYYVEGDCEEGATYYCCSLIFLSGFDLGCMSRNDPL
ncbi:MAG: hypothetical protein II919_08085 [Lachnospiraceae bacterium]|nr:hypothetical protein [Lachnospiraceae bacterium]